VTVAEFAAQMVKCGSVCPICGKNGGLRPILGGSNLKYIQCDNCGESSPAKSTWNEAMLRWKKAES
jgi:hypothetical protein